MSAPPADLGSHLVGTFTWDVHADDWSWSAETFALHGYRAEEVAPSFDLIVGHKVGEGRGRAERAMAQVDRPDFRFSNHHRITAIDGRERVVVSVGSAGQERGRLVLRGFMVDLTEHPDPRLDAALHHAPATLPALSTREREVLLLVASGCSNQEIAHALFVSVNTVKTYLRTTYRKLGVTRRSQAVLWAVAHRTQLDPP